MTPEINRLEDILDQLIDGTIRVIETGQVLSNEHIQLITEQIQWIESEIQRLYQELQVGGSPPPEEGIEQGQHPSSNIYGFKYDPEKQKLLIKFQDKYPATNGPVYSYDGVPSQVVELLAMGALPPSTTGGNEWHHWKEGVTPSMGATAIRLITNGQFPYQRIS